MHFLNTVVTAIAIGATTTSATCFPRGAWWWNKDYAKLQLEAACRDLKGTYAPGQVKSECKNAEFTERPWRQKYIFEVNNQNDHAVTLSHTACVRNIGREIQHCSFGGYENWGGVRMK